MTWFRVCDNFHSHPKLHAMRRIAPTVGVYTTAVTVWTLMGSYCARFLTDGQFDRVTAASITLLPQKAVDAALALLVQVELIECTSASVTGDVTPLHSGESGSGDGSASEVEDHRSTQTRARAHVDARERMSHRFHHWNEFQLSREQVESERAKARGRVEKHRENKANRDSGNAVTTAVTNGVRVTVTNGATNANGSPDVTGGVTGAPSHTISHPNPKNQNPPIPPRPTAPPTEAPSQPDAKRETLSVGVGEPLTGQNPEPRPATQPAPAVATSSPLPAPSPNAATSVPPPPAVPVVSVPTRERVLPFEVDSCVSELARNAGKGLAVKFTDPNFNAKVLAPLLAPLAAQGVTAAHFAVLGAWCSKGLHGWTDRKPGLTDLAKDGRLVDWLTRSSGWWEGLSAAERKVACPDGYPVVERGGPVRATKGSGTPLRPSEGENGQKNASGAPPANPPHTVPVVTPPAPRLTSADVRAARERVTAKLGIGSNVDNSGNGTQPRSKANGGTDGAAAMGEPSAEEMERLAKRRETMLAQLAQLQREGATDATDGG